jgi:hypothetical protein
VSDELKFERKQVLALKGVDGQLHDTVITQGPKLQRFAFPAGTRIFAQDDPGDIAFVVESGAVSIAQHRTDGSGDVEIAKIGAGVMFGELALIDGLARTASAPRLASTERFSITSSGTALSTGCALRFASNRGWCSRRRDRRGDWRTGFDRCGFT